MSTFPDGLFQYGGQPVASAVYANPWATAFFVDDDNGNDNNSGLKPAESKLTISSAITAASSGDVIYIRQPAFDSTDATEPGRYTENLVVPFAKSGLSLVGCGNNPHNPMYTMVKFSTAGYGVNLYAPSTTIENLCFNKDAATTGLIYINGDESASQCAWGTLLSNLQIRNADGTANPGVLFYAGSYCTIHNVDFEACHTGVYIASGGNHPIRSLRIQDCRFKGSNGSAVGGANIDSTGGSIIYELEILRCYFERVPTGQFIDLEGTTAYGIISDCHFGDDDVSCTTTGSNINKPTTVFVTGCYDDSGTMVVTT